MAHDKIRLFEFESLTYFLIRGAVVGIALYNMLNIAKQDSWIGILLAILLGIIPLILYYLVITLDENFNIIDNIKHCFGKLLGGAINVILGIFVFIFSCTVFANLLNFIHSQYLYKTPEMAIAITFGIAIYYLVSKGISVIARTGSILFYFSIFLFVIGAVGLFTQLDISNLKPFLENGISPIFQGSISYLAYTTLPLLLLTVIPKKQIIGVKHFIRDSILMYLLTNVMIFIVAFFLLCIYGIDFALLLQYPAFHLLKRLSLGGFIERLENIISILWIFDMIMFVVIGIYYVKQTIVQTFSLSFHKIISLLLVLLLIFISQLIFPNNTFGNIFILKLFPPFIYLFLLGFPILFLIVFKVKKAITLK